MTLKELTRDKHTEAENTKFMKCVFEKTLPIRLWNDYTLQRAFIYSSIETKCINFNLINPRSELIRAPKLMDDFLQAQQEYNCLPITIEYQKHIRSLDNPQLVLAHLYTWHMGDLFGGQAIKNIVTGVRHSALEFENRMVCVSVIRDLCDKWKVAETNEPNVAFDYAIKLLRSYENLL